MLSCIFELLTISAVALQERKEDARKQVWALDEHPSQLMPNTTMIAQTARPDLC